jgi:hypothetical protein
MINLSPQRDWVKGPSVFNQEGISYLMEYGCIFLTRTAAEGEYLYY